MWPDDSRVWGLSNERNEGATTEVGKLTGRFGGVRGMWGRGIRSPWNMKIEDAFRIKELD